MTVIASTLPAAERVTLIRQPQLSVDLSRYTTDAHTMALAYNAATLPLRVHLERINELFEEHGEGWTDAFSQVATEPSAFLLAVLNQWAAHADALQACVVRAAETRRGVDEQLMDDFPAAVVDDPSLGAGGA